jgi:PAS domain S-box-containing protein
VIDIESSQEILYAVMPFLGDAVLIENNLNRIVRVNPAASRLTGWREEEALGQLAKDILRFSEPKESGGGAHQAHRRSADLMLTARDGSLRPVEHIDLPIHDATGSKYGGLHVLRDTSPLALRGAQADRQILEAEAFEQRLQRMLLRARKDDSRQLVRARDVVGWLGDERFAVILENCSPPAAQRVAQKTCERLAQLQMPDGMQTVKLAVGVGLVPLDKRWGMTSALWHAAETCCQRAQESGRSQVHAWVDAEPLDSARQRELNVAARVQQTLLVNSPPQDIAALQISGYSLASQGINGDFVEFIRVSPDTLDVVVGDVMGKGMAAAMMGAATKLQFSRCMAELVAAHGGDPTFPSPSQVVAAVHRTMTPALQALEAFVTLCYLRIDTLGQRVIWVGCGHEEPMLVDGSGAVTLLRNQHPPLGILDEATYSEESLPLRPGDGLFLCSDGVSDAMRPQGDRVGHERLTQAVRRRMMLHDAPASVLHTLRLDVLGDGVEVNDDITMLVIRRALDGALQQARIELEPSLRSLRQLRAFLEHQVLACGLAGDAGPMLISAGVEGFTNIVRHALGLLDQAPVEVVARNFHDRVELALVHLGEPFEPPAWPADAAPAIVPEAGLGLAIMRQATDRLDYQHAAGVNTVKLVRFKSQ